MKITELLQKKTLSLSFEVFPPKTESNFEGVKHATEQIAALSPAYFDVLPLSLEEIFIYELGGVNYAVKDIIL